MLSGNFFYINGLQQSSGEISAVLEINVAHKIFEGHFPGQPVVPGVCMLQMVKEILELALKKSLQLLSAENLKFLTVIDPTKICVIQAELRYFIDENEKIKLAASLVNEAVTYFKMNALFSIDDEYDVWTNSH